MFSFKSIPACLVLATLFLLSCTSHTNQAKEQLGDISFDVTGNAEAQPFFKKGLLFLHSFEYDDAAEEFQQAIKADPTFVMAYWGEAMTHHHPLWREQDFDKGNEILRQLAPTPEERVAKAKTDLEKDFIKGVNILYGKGNKAERDSSYSAYVGTLYKKYPGNNEVTSFYSLSLIGWALADMNMKTFEQAADIAKEVLTRNPKHPGALHYIIHAYDNPAHASLALATADKYAQVAPDAGHALHMPTHTYLALGIWDKVISSNEVSWAAEKNRKERKKLDNDALGYHSYHWLLYGYLQQGKKEKARSMVDSMKQYCSTLPSPAARAHMIFIKTTYLIETSDYDEQVAGISFQNEDLNILTRIRNHFAEGMRAYYKKDAAGMDKIIMEIAGERLIDQSRVAEKGIRVCGNVNRSLPTLSDLHKSEVMELELKAMQAWLKKDTASTEHWMKKATEKEATGSYAYGPPSIVKPSFELYGEWLLEVNRPQEALKQFEESLKWAPNKLLSVQGKEKATALLKETGLAKM